MNTPTKDQECCPKFDPTPWDGKEFNWDNKRFIKDKVRTFLFMPLNFGAVITRMSKKIEAADEKWSDSMCLSDHPSKWSMNLYSAVDKEIPGAENITLSGRFFSRVYEGNFKNTGKWCQDFAATVKSKGWNLKKMYMWYTTCPKCAKKYGKNYVVIVGEIK